MSGKLSLADYVQQLLALVAAIGTRRNVTKEELGEITQLDKKIEKLSDKESHVYNAPTRNEIEQGDLGMDEYGNTTFPDCGGIGFTKVPWIGTFPDSIWIHKPARWVQCMNLFADALRLDGEMAGEAAKTDWSALAKTSLKLILFLEKRDSKAHITDVAKALNKKMPGSRKIVLQIIRRASEDIWTKYPDRLNIEVGFNPDSEQVEILKIPSIHGENRPQK